MIMLHTNKKSIFPAVYELDTLTNDALNISFDVIDVNPEQDLGCLKLNKNSGKDSLSKHFMYVGDYDNNASNMLIAGLLNGIRFF